MTWFERGHVHEVGQLPKQMPVLENSARSLEKRQKGVTCSLLHLFVGPIYATLKQRESHHLLSLRTSQDGKSRSPVCILLDRGWDMTASAVHSRNDLAVHVNCMGTDSVLRSYLPGVRRRGDRQYYINKLDTKGLEETHLGFSYQ